MPPLRRRFRIAAAGLALVAGLGAAAFAWTQVPKWIALGADGIHDPTNPGLATLQEPGAALSALAPDTVGNQVRWMRALESGQIAPRAAVLEAGSLERRDTVVVMHRTGEMPAVRFPHAAHTQWLACANCHDELFAKEAGKTRVNMALILSGEKCGVCHGAVAFPLTECLRCHSGEREVGERPARDVPSPTGTGR